MNYISTKKNDSLQNRALAWVAAAAAGEKDFHRPWAGGILFHAGDTPEEVRAVATDGRRLHVATFPATFIEEIRSAIVWGPAQSDWCATKIKKFNRTELILEGHVAHPFVDYGRVVPRCAYRLELPGDPDNLLCDVMVAIQDAGALVPRFNLRYIAALTDYDWCPDSVEYDACDKGHVFRQQHDPYHRLAVVMPLERTHKEVT